MTANEKKILLQFMKDYGDTLGNAGCNDMRLKNTKENRRLVRDATLWSCGEGLEVIEAREGNTIVAADFVVLGYLRHKFAEENGLE